MDPYKNDPFGQKNWEKRLLKLKKNELLKVARAWNFWFSSLVDDDIYPRIDRKSTKAEIVQHIVWQTDPITSEGGLLDFLNHIKISNGKVTYKVELKNLIVYHSEIWKNMV